MTADGYLRLFFIDLCDAPVMTEAEPAPPKTDDAADGSDRMIFEEPIAPVVRVFLVSFGLFTFFAPWDLLIRPGHPFELAKLPFWVISLGALSIGVPMLIGGVLAPARTLVVDFERRLFVETIRGGFGLRFDRSRRFVDLIEIDVVEDAWSDGPPTWSLRARFHATRRPWPIRNLARREAVEALRAAIVARIAAVL